MPEVIADRRDAPRYPLILVAEVTEIASGLKLTSRTSDVSRTGCHLDSANPTSLGKSIRLPLTRDEEAIETEGHAVYITPGLGMGVRFHENVKESRLLILDRRLSEIGESGSPRPTQN